VCLQADHGFPSDCRQALGGSPRECILVITASCIYVCLRVTSWMLALACTGCCYAGPFVLVCSTLMVLTVLMEAKSAARASRASSFVVVQFHARLQHPMSGVSVLANTTVAAAAAANADHTAADREAVVYLIPHFMQLPGLPCPRRQPKILSTAAHIAQQCSRCCHCLSAL